MLTLSLLRYLSAHGCAPRYALETSPEARAVVQQAAQDGLLRSRPRSGLVELTPHGWDVLSALEPPPGPRPPEHRPRGRPAAPLPGQPAWRPPLDPLAALEARVSALEETLKRLLASGSGP